MSKARASRVKRVSSTRKNPKAINPGNSRALGGKHVGARKVSSKRVYPTTGAADRVGG